MVKQVISGRMYSVVRVKVCNIWAMAYDDASCRMVRFQDKFVVQRKYLQYLHQTNTIVFSMISAVKQIKFELSGTVLSKVSLCEHVIVSPLNEVGEILWFHA